jgi:hypothetical protein
LRRYALSLLKKLRMRAKVEFEDVSDAFKVVASVAPSEGDAADPDADERGLSHFAFLPMDPRWPGLGLRGVVGLCTLESS